MIRKIVSAACIAAALSATAQAQPANYNAEDAMKAFGALMSAGATTNAQAIHFRQLKELLPAEYAGMKRSNVEAGKNAAFGMNISYAEATYSKDQSRITVKLQDISSMGQFMRMAQFAWANNEMERETDDGYERTTKIEGFPAQESYRSDSKSGELQIMVGERFIVEADGNGVTMEQIKGLLNAIGLKKLSGLKPAAE